MSRRRAYHTALAYERGRNGGRLMPFGLFSAFTARQVVKTVEGQDFHQALARSEQHRPAAVPASFLTPEVKQHRPRRVYVCTSAPTTTN